MQESPQHSFSTSKYYVLAISVSNFITLSAFLRPLWIIIPVRLIMEGVLGLQTRVTWGYNMRLVRGV